MHDQQPPDQCLLVVRLNKTEATKQANACHYLVPISLLVRKIMSCNVVVRLVSLTFIVMFSSVFAQKNIDEEGINERIIRSLRDTEVIPNRTSGGDTNS